MGKKKKWGKKCINDVTQLNRPARTVTARFGTVDESNTYFMNELTSLYEAVREASPTTKLVTCLIYGIHLATYNRTEPHPDQDLVNSTVAEINKLIVGLNISNDVVSPRLSQHLYLRFRDGCHPTDETQLKVAKYLARAISSNRSLGNHK